MRLACLAVVVGALGCTPVPGPPCRTNADCDDGLACNGVEVCVARQCWRLPGPNCDDGVDCTRDECIDPVGTCSHAPEDARCADASVCNGEERCEADVGCVAGTPFPCPADTVSCTLATCVDPETPGGEPTCVQTPDDAFCRNDAWCDGDEWCGPALDCQPGALRCDDAVACTVDSCNEVLDVCFVVPDDASCEDGLFCTDNSCDPASFPGDPSGCVLHPHDCSDPFDCTVDTCDDVADACVRTPDDDACADVDQCNFGVCDLFLGCGATPAPDGTSCVPDTGGIGVCVAGVCEESECGDAVLGPDEECDFALHRIGCSATCGTLDFVVSDEFSLGGDDGREEVGPADRAVAILESGDRFVVVWTQDQDVDPDFADVVARVVDVGEGATSVDIMVGGGAMPQEKPVVAALPDGGFVVAWHGYDSAGGGDDVDVYIKVCGVTITPAMGLFPAEVSASCGTSIRANTTDDQAQVNPTVAVAATTERIILAWEDWSPYGEGIAPWNLSGIRYRMFDLDGRATTDFATDRLANFTTDDVQAEPSVAALESGDFIIAWSDAGGAALGSDGFEVRARIFDAAGDPTTADDFVVNLARMTYEQYEPTTAPVEAPVPGFLVAWTSMEDLGD